MAAAPRQIARAAIRAAHIAEGKGVPQRSGVQRHIGLLPCRGLCQQRLEAVDLLPLSLVGEELNLSRAIVPVHLAALHKAQVRQDIVIAVFLLAQLRWPAQQRLRRRDALLRVDVPPLHRQHRVFAGVRHLDRHVDAHGLPAHLERLLPALRRFVPRRGRGRGGDRLLQRPVQPVEHKPLLRRRLAGRKQNKQQCEKRRRVSMQFSVHWFIPPVANRSPPFALYPAYPDRLCAYRRKAMKRSAPAP